MRAGWPTRSVVLACRKGGGNFRDAIVNTLGIALENLRVGRIWRGTYVPPDGKTMTATTMIVMIPDSMVACVAVVRF